MPGVLRVSLASSCGARVWRAAPVPPLAPSWVRKGSDGSMLARLKNWVQASRERKRERIANRREYLSEQEKQEIDRLREEHSLLGRDISPDRDFGNRPGT